MRFTFLDGGQLRRLVAFGLSPGVAAGARNAAFNVADQMATPVLMVAAAPFLSSRMGFEQFGVWMLVLALTGSLSVFHFGLGDATIKFISQHRGGGNPEGVARTFRVNLTLGTLLGALAAVGLFWGAPFIANTLFSAGPAFSVGAIRSIKLGGLILALRSVESILANTLRAFDDYAGAARVSVSVKIGVVVSAVALVAHGFGVVAILVATAVFVTVGLVAYTLRIRQTVGRISFKPEFDMIFWREISGFGFYSWLQSIAAMMFSQADKLIVGGMMGLAAAGRYAICTQLAAIIQMIAASGFNFLFPQFSRRHEAGDRDRLRRIFHLAMVLNLTLVAALTLPLLLGGKYILTQWMGIAFAEQSWIVLAVLTVAYAGLAINVVPYLMLLGIGKIRFACFANIVAGFASVAAALLLIRPLGLVGAGLGRLVYGAVVSVCYIEAVRTLQSTKGVVASATALD